MTRVSPILYSNVNQSSTVVLNREFFKIPRNNAFEKVGKP